MAGAVVRARRFLPASIALLVLASQTCAHAPLAAPAPTPTWSFTVSLDGAGLASVDAVYRDLPPITRLCFDLDGAGRFLAALEQLSPDGARPVPRDPDDADCFLPAPASAGSPLHVRYRQGLDAMARAVGDPDFATGEDGDYAFGDRALLLRPTPHPRSTLLVELDLPPGASAVAPWEKLAGPGHRFRVDSEDFEHGSYIAVGKLHPLGALAVKGGAAQLTTLSRLADRDRRPLGDDDLRRWIATALSAVSDFYGEVPGAGRGLSIILWPVRGSTEPGIFGTVLHKGLRSVVLFFGADAAPADFASDWVAFHELFHLGNPVVEGRLPWFVEGFTTYYQDVIRARRGVLGEAAAWADLDDGFRRFCQPERGASLADESRDLRRRHHYQRVYWGGACLAFRLDVAIRERSGNRKSLDDVMRALRDAPSALDEPRIVAALDQAAGRPLAREHLHAKKALPVDQLERRLGIRAEGKDVRLADDAPLSSLRRAITAPVAGAPGFASPSAPR